ncbi:hypothetical protein [Cellulosimicrobium protaetiae]|uniref:Uncharacterized protein n=1 Tax=Cellulosimicrobium protaetiae TaxID=2587808 RepID=A0A6M5UJU9_9MICO|nr:hypothetical protein [Cellulosimicrobium protaetiae]QJW37378.1 hypothetical protein FIC82_015530 [Cellulosimicrobium protaetiae]
MLVEIVCLALGMAAVAGAVVTVGTLGGLYRVPESGARRQELLRLVLAERFCWVPGDPVDEAWATSMSRELREHETVPDAEERRKQLIALGLRLQGKEPTPTAIGEVDYRSEMFDARARKRLADASMTAPSIPALLVAWRRQCGIEEVRSVAVSLRITLSTTLQRVGIRAATLIGLGSAAAVVGAVMVWALVGIRTPLVDLAGQWVAVVSVVMVGLLVVLEVRDHLLPELARGGRLGGWVLVVPLVLGLPTAVALAQRRGWLASGAQLLDDRIGSWLASPVVGAVVVCLLLLLPIAGATQRSWRWRTPPVNRSAPGQRSDRVEAITTATGFALMAVLGITAVADVEDLYFPLGVAFFGIVVLGSLVVGSLRFAEHRGRTKDLRQAGADPARGTFRWWIVGLAILAPTLLDPLALAIGSVVEHSVVAPGGVVRGLALAMVFSVAVIVAALAVPGVLVWQGVAALRRYRRALRGHRALVWEMRVHARRERSYVEAQRCKENA